MATCPAERLPSLSELSAQRRGMSMGKLREQFEIARTLGLVEASRRRDHAARGTVFLPAVRLSSLTALAIDGFIRRRPSAGCAPIWKPVLGRGGRPADRRDFATLRSFGWRRPGRIETTHPRFRNQEHRERTPDDLPPPRQPVCRGPAGSILRRMRRWSLNTFTPITATCKRCGATTSASWRRSARGRWRKASGCLSSICSCSTRGASP